MFTENMIKKISAPINPRLIKSRQIAGTNLKYLSGNTVIDMLNDVFKYMWDWEITRQWIEEGVGKGKGGYVAHVEGRLKVYLKNGDEYFPITKMASGSKVIVGGVSQQDSIFKAAGTDALKKAASLFGIGLELWRDEDEVEWFVQNALNQRFKEAWTPEKREEFKEELNELNEYNKKLGANKMSNALHSFSRGGITDLREVLPENISEFISYMKKLEQQTEAGGN